jgi:hypothetical protein
MDSVTNNTSPTVCLGKRVLFFVKSSLCLVFDSYTSAPLRTDSQAKKKVYFVFCF